MAECEVCGKGVSAARRAEIDGVILDVCEDCAKLGKEVYQPRKIVLHTQHSVGSAPRPESIEDAKEFAGDFSVRVRKAREHRNLTQDEAAKAIGISHLVYKRVESGFKPDEAIARKIQRFFGIELYAKEK